MVGRFIPESSTGGQGGGAHAASPVSCEMRAPPATTRQCVGPGRLRKGAFPCTDGGRRWRRRRAAPPGECTWHVLSPGSTSLSPLVTEPDRQRPQPALRERGPQPLVSTDPCPARLRPAGCGAPRLCLSGPCFLLTTNGTEDTGAGKNACLWEERLDKVRRLLDPRSERHMNIFMPI